MARHTTIYSILCAFLVCLACNVLDAQDTFSIVAMDSATGEVGSAGASCVDMFTIPGYPDDFLGELFPGQGAINSQAWYIPANQANARTRMNQGDSPAEIIQWLVDNDVNGQPELRQYGIVKLHNGNLETAAHTGTSTDDYKNHITGPNYSIQGNILLGPEILDSMESRFLNAEGDLACKLMAALQGANVVGADSRCAPNGTSSLFAFVKVAQPTDPFGAPSFLASVRTHDGEGIEPIDSLQTLFDQLKSCIDTTTVSIENRANQPMVYPNPIHDLVHLPDWTNIQATLFDASGRNILATSGPILDLSSFVPGIYFLRVVHSNGKLHAFKLVKL